jgi:hypothetical protein
MKVVPLLTQETVLCNMITERYSEQCEEKWQREYTSDTLTLQLPLQKSAFKKNTLMLFHVENI